MDSPAEEKDKFVANSSSSFEQKNLQEDVAAGASNAAETKEQEESPPVTLEMNESDKISTNSATASGSASVMVDMGMITAEGLCSPSSPAPTNDGTKATTQSVQVAEELSVHGEHKEEGDEKEKSEKDEPVPSTDTPNNGVPNEEENKKTDSSKIPKGTDFRCASAPSSSRDASEATPESAIENTPLSSSSFHQSNGQPQQQQQTPPQSSSLILSLPIDSLHSIASFLSPTEWTNFGQCDKGTNKVCREIFRRVRMHGFLCATEVITAWKLGHHADARELCALYISAGVPIYPQSLGHSYHTLVWRLGVEAKTLQQRRQDENAAENSLNVAGPASVAAGGGAGQNDSNSNSIDGISDDHPRPPPVDPFYTDRDEFRPREDLIPSSIQGRLSYLEEKATYTLDSIAGESEVNRITRSIRRHMSMAHSQRVPTLRPMNGENIHQQQSQLPRDPLLPPPAPPVRWDSFMGINSRNGTPRRQIMRSNSFTDVRFRPPKVLLKIHRHLLDQHLLGRAAVNDKEGTMTTPAISLSADFFHPHFSLRSSAAAAALHQISGRHNKALRISPSSSTRADGTFEATDVLPAFDRSFAVALSDPAGGHSSGREGVSALHFSRSAASLASAEETDSDAELEMVHPRPMLMEPGNELALENAVGATEMEPPAMAPMFPAMAQLPASTGVVSTTISASESIVSTEPQFAFHNDIWSSIDLEVYNASSSTSKTSNKPEDQLRSHLKTRFGVYQRRLEKHLSTNDSDAFEECVLDFWDEFLPQTAYIHYYDEHTAVPRLSCLQKFLSRPCPKAIGIVQCEIERIKVGSKKKGVNMKGRFFPTYEYRLFIRHRPDDQSGENGADMSSDDENKSLRRDTLLMVAKNRGRKHVENTGKAVGPSTSKKGSNNYYLYLPQQEDVDLHFKGVNGTDFPRKPTPNGSFTLGTAPAYSSLLGRLQSNFIGTEFQIFTPRVLKTKLKAVDARPLGIGIGISSDEEGVLHENVASTDLSGPSSRRKSRFGRLSLRGRNNNDENRLVGEDELSRPIELSPSGLTLRRSRSSGDMAPLRKSRTSRRVSAADALESQQQTAQPEPTFFEEEDGAITYTANLLGSRPRIMDVCIPKVDSDGTGVEWKRYLENCEDAEGFAQANRMLSHLKQLQQRGDGDEAIGRALQTNNNDQTARNNGSEARDFDEGGGYTPPDDFGLLALQNRPPWWNVELGSFVLNFGGRVSVASVKNFQLCDRNDQDYIMLQFGRIQGRHSFTMDFQYPLTGVQAFAIAISSLQSKISFG